jgi:hypothetical protein
MQDPNVFAFGLFVFVVLAGGLFITVREFIRMGNQDQEDSYPRSISKPSRSSSVKRSL